MKFWRKLGWPGRIGLVLLGLFLLGSLDWRRPLPPRPPETVLAFHTSGQLKAGAAKTEIVPPFKTPMAGFSTRGNDPYEGVLDPLHARAIVLESGGKRIALVSADLVVIPAPLREKVLAALQGAGLDDLVLTATHTHAGIGGYWDSRIAGWIGLGSYDARTEQFLVERISQVVRDAATRLAPARLGAAAIDASNFGINRNVPKGPVDGLLTAARITGLDGQVIAKIVVFAAHPTILHRDSMRLSADWPGAMTASLETDGGVALFMQGAEGDTTWGKRAGDMPLEQRMQLFGNAVASDARGALAAGGEGEAEVTFEHARERLVLPAASADAAVPGIFEPLAANLLQWMAYPGTTEVSFTKIGPLALAAIPGEVVAELGMAWRRKLGGGAIVGLADAYVGYVETPERVEQEEGEAVRTYFGPHLAPVLLDGLTAAKAAAEQAPAL